MAEPAISVADLPQLIADMASHAHDKRLQAVTNVRKLLSAEHEPPIDAAIAAGVLPLLVAFLMERHDGEPKLQYESAWALTNITAGSSVHVQAVFDAGAVTLLLRACYSVSPDVREQALWCIGNMAAESARFRDAVLSFGALQPVLENLGDPDHARVVRTGGWVLANLLGGSPPPPRQDLAALVLPALTMLLQSDDDNVVADAARALASLSDGPSYGVIASAVPRLVHLLRTHSKAGALGSVLRVLGVLAAEGDEQRRALLDENVLEGLARTLGDESLTSATCWVIGGLLSGTAAQVQAVLDAQAWVHALTRLVQSAPLDDAAEAAIALSQATGSATRAQIDLLLQADLLRTLYTPHARGCNDERYLRATVRALRNLLTSGGVDAAAIESSDLLVLVAALASRRGDAALSTDLPDAAAALLRDFFGQPR